MFIPIETYRARDCPVCVCVGGGGVSGPPAPLHTPLDLRIALETIKHIFICTVKSRKVLETRDFITKYPVQILER